MLVRRRAGDHDPDVEENAEDGEMRVTEILRIISGMYGNGISLGFRVRADDRRSVLP